MSYLAAFVTIKTFMKHLFVYLSAVTRHSYIIIGASLSEPHHACEVNSEICLLACMFVCLSPPYMVECNQKYIKSHLSVNHAC